MRDVFPETMERLEQWKAQPEVLGVILVGSQSRGHADDLSDDDLEVLLDEEQFAQREPEACIEFLIEGVGEQRKLIYDTQYTTLAVLRRKLTSPHDLDHWPYERAQILFERDECLKPIVEGLGRMDAAFRHARLLHATIDTSIAIGRATKTLRRGHEAAAHLQIARGVKALSRLCFALEWRWMPLDHWLENELQTLEDPTEVGPQLIEALKSGNPQPLRTALDSLESWLSAEGVPDHTEQDTLFFELIHPRRAEERAIHGLY